jgi:hypothetical protein
MTAMVCRRLNLYVLLRLGGHEFTARQHEREAGK